ncbi:response regulator [Caulobacter mirabilis]|uniref:DNA-binding response regulator n=1 Tax=Caulobacter mirabilis TaxID=69666 RepID=A0A2D2AVF9_9CAUL|nr:response regulator transcription factor [Caulobacter mirabilis]ATQ41947.1 DNA-binding response regulator [Caulobacter mirabilis]
MKRTLKAALADDHAIVREGLKLLLSIMDDIVVVGEAGDAAETLSMLKTEAVDLLFLDLGMPGRAGMQFVRELREGFPALRILVLTANTEPRAVRAALEAGADGYLTKTGDPAELSAAVEAVRAGQGYVGQTVRFLTAQGRPGHAEPAAEAVSAVPLTRRERQMLGLIAQGATTREAAERLGVSLPTARKHRENLMRKLDLHSAAELGAYAARLGLPAG